MVAIVATPLRAQPWTPVKEGATLQPHILQVFTMKTKPRNVYTLQAKHATGELEDTLEAKNCSSPATGDQHDDKILGIPGKRILSSC